MVPEGRPLPEEATAQTLHHALGNLGGRQKSWMALPSNAPALPPVVPAQLSANPLPFTVRGRGRPRKHPVPVTSTRPKSPNTIPQISPQAHPTIETEPQPLSNSTSPQLPNVAAAQNNATHGPSAAHVFPSPTPSEETSAYLPPHESAPAKRPSEGQAQQSEKRRRSQAFGQDQPVSIANTTDALPNLPRRPSGQTNSRSLSLGITASLQIPQGIQFQDPRLSRTSPQPHGPWMLPQTTSQAPNSRSLSRAAHSYDTPMAPSARRSSSDGWYARKDCLQILNNFQALHPPSPGHPQDGRRLRVLWDAAKEEDWFYLTMHQYYCLLTHAPQVLPEGLKKSPGLQKAQNILGDVLDLNHRLSPNYLYLFTNFPYPIEQIAAMWPAKFEHQALLFREFVVQSQNYNQLKTLCQRRRCPPLARELAVELRIASPTFQRLLFTALLRSLCRTVLSNPRFTKFEAQAVAIFRQNQADYHQRQLYPVAELLEYQQQEKNYEDQTWGSKLRTLVKGFEAILLEQGLSLADIYNGAPQPQQQQVPAAPRYHPQHVQSTSSITNTNAMPPRSNSAIGPHSAQAAIRQSRGRGRPTARPAQPAGVSPAPVLPFKQTGRPLLPVLNYQQPQQRVPNPTRFALHQAHLRSPVLQSQSKSSQLYVFNQGFLKPPARLSASGRIIERWSFTLTPTDFQRIATTVRDPISGPGAMNVNETNKFVRLRCVEWPQSKPIKNPTDDLWAVADTHWIPHSYYTFNGTPLEPRIKVHYGKDLPIDLTGLLKEGENVLEFVVMAQSGDTSCLNYLIAIEVMGISSHESIKQHCLNQSRVSADEVLQGIKKKLAGVDDDEITVVQSTLTIGLFDPFSQAKMCDIPVRSKACPHNDCFDLETFLQSRPHKGDASVADQWKCPICKSDARPHMLIVDGFIENVKKQLESRRLASTRHVLVQQDGSWQPKAEVREGVSDDTPEPVARRAVPADVEIIDLSD
ncbi:hypothetical protein G6011_02125 [Alternaria panax]|uniref:SP-RING-type domain-containing protein n=1 Tax=Alternaria panax TaxID=48097 RepID=A0AAD4I762_9PLEO|nr:hypothetical protein G6011_02125 [Alternaria panax]